MFIARNSEIYDLGFDMADSELLSDAFRFCPEDRQIERNNTDEGVVAKRVFLDDEKIANMPRTTLNVEALNLIGTQALAAHLIGKLLDYQELVEVIEIDRDIQELAKRIASAASDCIIANSPPVTPQAFED